MKFNNTLLRHSLLVLFTLAGLKAQSQEIGLPDSPVGQIATEFFKAFNTDDEALMKDFTANYRTESALKRIPLESRMVQHRQIKGMIKSLSPRKVTASSPEALTVLVFAEAIDSWFECSFGMSETEKGKLENFGLKPATAPDEDEGFGEWTSLEGLLQNAIARHNIPGLSMAVIENGQITQSAVAGIRRLNSAEKVQLNDRFHIGSITKSMTATLIGRLMEQGKLKPESSLKSLLPEVDMLPAYEKVTITQLLHHRAGIPAYLTVSDEEEAELLSLPGNPSAQRLAFAAKVLRQQPNSTPGTAFAYSNAGYSILGVVAERLDGKAWTQQLEEYLFKPLAMSTAGTDWPRSAERPQEPAGHFGPLDQVRMQSTDEYVLGAYIEPAGDVHASMSDLARYALDHMNGINGKNGLLQAATYQWLHNAEPGQSYAAGWFLNPSESGVLVHEHSGSAGTFLAMMMIEPENNRGWVIAANVGDIALDGVLRKLVKAWKDR